MNLRPFLFAAVLIPSASFAATGDPCVPADFTESCNDDGTLQLCDNVTDAANPVEVSLSCAEAFGQPSLTEATCGTAPGCVGDCTDGPTELACSAPSGGACLGLGVQVNQSTDDDDLAGAVLCAGTDTCSTQVNAAGNALEDVCVPHIGPACAPGSEPACVGSVLTICLSGDELALTSNVALDCALFEGGACGEQACECDAQCGTEGKCTNGVCEGGVTCTFTPDPADCTAGGEGEGEGEGEGGDGEGGGRRDDEPEETPTSLCSTMGTMDATFGFALLGLVAVRRRRR